MKIYILLAALSVKLFETKLVANEKLMEMAYKQKQIFPSLVPINMFTTCHIILAAKNSESAVLFFLHMKQYKCPQIVITFDDSHFILEDTSTSSTLLLIEDYRRFETEVDRIVDSRFFTNMGNYRFILCYNLETEGEVLIMARFIWSRRILNFSIFCAVRFQMFEVRYDPFLDKLKFYSRESQRNIDESAIDMQNNVFDILTDHQFPDLHVHCFYNYDRNVLKAIEKVLNANLRLIYLSEDDVTFEYIATNISKSDITCCIKTLPIMHHLIPPEFDGVLTYTYPHMMNHIVALVPKAQAIAQWKWITRIIKIRFLVILIIASVLFSYLENAAAQNRFHIVDALMVFAKIPFNKFVKRRSLLKTAWLLASLFLGMFYDTTIFQIILCPKLDRNIRTVQDIRATNLPIYYFEPLPINISFTLIPKTNWENLLLSNKEDAVFLSPYHLADKYIKYFANANEEYRYEIMQEPLIPAYGAYICKNRSPYVRKLQEISLRVRVFGVTDRIPYRYRKRNVEDNKMYFGHFRGVFVLLLGGYVLSSVVFVWEFCHRNVK
ncbi:hypothetical protein GWI33_015529 [Rhynchophorus ferrugineus]|uniref:Ionotropic receptor n=1 Tax=Rhynchophorus ferrugineus TaxID=354439 RepID=A0A834HZ30_RHYFE|nr:hypothetical protein GWI33_015529 [Rhynchophorus ferrugineus]